MTEIRITVTNTSGPGGTTLTPFWFGAHDAGFDLYDRGEAASEGLERIAEDGTFDAIGAELVAADPEAQGGIVTGARGPIVPGETASTTVVVDGAATPQLSLAAMVIPSNDAFVGTGTALQLFDAHGRFLGAQTVTFAGSDVLDAGTEVNTERDAAFINQTAPDAGLEEGGVIGLHPGFNGSLGNPGGEQIILGGTDAFGQVLDPVAADLTQPGAQIAEVHVNVVNRQTGDDGRDFLIGGTADDVFEGAGGRDVLFGGRGYDVLSGGDGRDYLNGGRGDDILDGGAGRDLLFGGQGRDVLRGGEGRDDLLGGRGDDVLEGGAGNDLVNLGRGGADVLIFSEGDGRDRVRNFDEADRIVLDVEGFDDFSDIEAAATQRGGRTVIDFGDGDALILTRTELSDLSADDFVFV